MDTKVICVQFDSGPPEGLDILTRICKENDFTVESPPPIDDHDKIPGLLGSEPALILIPAKPEDCMGVKCIQEAVSAQQGHVILPWSKDLPPNEYLCLSFREGADDFLTVSAGEDALKTQILRARKRLMQRRESIAAAAQLEAALESLQQQNENLERKLARHEERLLALASAGTRLATGELRLSECNPTALIVTSSQSQNDSAAEFAARLGFSSQKVKNGKEALEMLQAARPRVILTSGTLEDMDACDFARQARKTLKNQPVIIIAWSSSPEQEDRILAPDSGIDDFVPKRSDNESNERLAASLLGALR